MEPNTDMTRAMVPSVRVLAPQLLIAGVLPVVAYALLRPHVSSDTVGLAAVMVFPLAEIAFERWRHGRFEPIGMIALVGIGVGLAGALALNGNALLLKVRESMLTGVFGAVCLASLGAKRPVMFFLGRSFSAGTDPAKLAEFDTLWELPTVPRRFRFVTAVWGVALVAEAGVRTALAVILPTQSFLVVAQVINWSVLGGLLWFTVRFIRSGEQQVFDLVAPQPEPG